MKIRLNKKKNLDLLYQGEERIDLSSPEAQERLKQALREKLTFQGIAEKYRREAERLLETDLDPERADDLRSMLFRLDEADRARDRGDLGGALMNAFLAGKMVVAVDTLPLAKKGFDAQGGRCRGGSKEKTDPIFMKLIETMKEKYPQEGWPSILDRLKESEFGWDVDGFEISYNEASDTFECREKETDEQKMISKRKAGALKNYFYK